jgi:hypothetical protein
MQLSFHNSYGPRIWVAIMFYDPVGCADYGEWGTRGWYAIDYGGTALVLNTDNHYAYFYAEAADGGVWNGPYGPIYVTQQPFSSCINIGRTDARRVGLREVYIPSNGLIVNLIR